MKVKFLAVKESPERYSFDGETVTAHYRGGKDTFDLSAFKSGDALVGLETTLDLDGGFIIRNIKRNNGILYVTLCQKPSKGHWRGIGEWIDADDYDPNKMYIKEVGNVG